MIRNSSWEKKTWNKDRRIDQRHLLCWELRHENQQFKDQWLENLYPRISSCHFLYLRIGWGDLDVLLLPQPLFTFNQVIYAVKSLNVPARHVGVKNNIIKSVQKLLQWMLTGSCKWSIMALDNTTTQWFSVCLWGPVNWISFQLFQHEICLV